MPKEYMHKVKNGPSDSSFYGRIKKNMNIDDALAELTEQRTKFSEAQWMIGRCASGASKLNAFQQLQMYRKYAPIMVKAFNISWALGDYFAEQIMILEENTKANANKKWTKEEEENVIDMICAGCSELEISIKTGRTIGAIHTKVSSLTGLSKPRKINGEFSGYVGGETFNGNINGVFKKNNELSNERRDNEID